MTEISVGQVSGILNVAIVLIQLTFPLAVVVILISFLSNENNAVTWSVVTRTLHSSMWASILGADSASFHGVRKRVTWLGAFSTFGIILLAVAGVVTPLGLDDDISVHAGSIQMVEFEYAPDPGPMGQGTPTRAGYKFSRLCGSIFLTNCPGQFAGSHSWKNATGYYADTEGTMSSKTPKNITDIYTSGTLDKGNTISNFFDIQYRYFFDDWKDPSDKTERQKVDNGQPYTVGTSRYIDTLLFKDGFSVVEGLVVDTTSMSNVSAGPTGVGFRNHTVPKGMKYGATWEEELLWIEPVTECVDTNLTLEYTIGSRRDYLVLNVTLVDNGGFSELDLNYQPFAETAPHTQQDPKLRDRAYISTWFNNALTMLALGVTRKTREKGSKYRLWYNETTGQSMGQSQVTYTHPEKIMLLRGGGWYLDLSNAMNNVTAKNFTDQIEYAMQRQTANRVHKIFDIDAIQSDGGMIVGAGRLTSGGTSLLAAPGTQWSQPMFYCASAIRATIKQVTFHYNQTHPGESLEKLRVTKIVDKTYSSEADYPLWAVEKTNLTMSEASPLWGIISPEHANKTQHLWTVKSPHLWLPADSGNLGIIDSTAGTGPSFEALTQIWDPLTDYNDRARNGYALFEKWQRLSSSADTASRMINLLWTDSYAQLVTGTKSTISSYETNPYEKFGLGVSTIHPRSETPKEEQPKRLFPVLAYRRKLTFKRAYGIPAFIILSLWAIVCIASIILLIGGRASLPVLKELLNQTSTGRVVTNLAHPDACPPNAKTKEWVRRAGMKQMGFLRIRKDSTTGTGNGSTTDLNIPTTYNSEPIIQTYHVVDVNAIKLQGVQNSPYSSNSAYTEKPKDPRRGNTPVISIDTTNTGASPSSQHLEQNINIPPSPANPFGSPFSPYGPNSPYSQYPVQSSSTSFVTSTAHLASTISTSYEPPSPSEGSKNNDSNNTASVWSPVQGEVCIRHKNSESSLGSRKTPKRADTGLSEVRLGLIGGRGTPIKNVFVDEGSPSQGNGRFTWSRRKE